jgi:hypothetical protein
MTATERQSTRCHQRLRMWLRWHRRLAMVKLPRSRDRGRAIRARWHWMQPRQRRQGWPATRLLERLIHRLCLVPHKDRQGGPPEWSAFQCHTRASKIITGIGTPRSHNKIPRPIFTSRKCINAEIQCAMAVPVPQPIMFWIFYKLQSIPTPADARAPAEIAGPPGPPGGPCFNV